MTAVTCIGAGGHRRLGPRVIRESRKREGLERLRPGYLGVRRRSSRDCRQMPALSGAADAECGLAPFLGGSGSVRSVLAAPQGNGARALSGPQGFGDRHCPLVFPAPGTLAARSGRQRRTPHSAAEGFTMKTKASWKPVGHSANKWRESTHRRGIVLNTTMARGEGKRKRSRNPLAT